MGSFQKIILSHFAFRESCAAEVAVVVKFCNSAFLKRCFPGNFLKFLKMFLMTISVFSADFHIFCGHGIYSKFIKFL